MKKSRSQAIVQARCPRCWQGDIFSYKFLNLKKPLQTNKHCPHCKLRYEIEPGFFWGAMYISYALSVGLYAIIILGIYLLMPEPKFWHYLTGVIVSTLLFAPLSFRFSRVLMLYFFSGVKYDSRFEQLS